LYVLVKENILIFSASLTRTTNTIGLDLRPYSNSSAASITYHDSTLTGSEDKVYVRYCNYYNSLLTGSSQVHQHHERLQEEDQQVLRQEIKYYFFTEGSVTFKSFGINTIT
jgi:hypothetical protein